MDLPGISVSEASGQIYLRCEPSVQRPPVEPEHLYGLLQESGFGNCQQDEAAIAQVATMCNTGQNVFSVQIAERRNGAVLVEVASDGMSASLSLVPPAGGQGATVQQVQQALADAGVVFGIDLALVEQVCSLGEADHVVVAQGQHAEPGTDTRFDPLIPATADRAPKVDEQGLIDYREHHGITVVVAGTDLMRREPPTAGVEGHTVRGQALAAKAGRNEAFAAELSGACAAPDDPDLLRASVSGQPVLVQHGVIVEPVLRVKDVDLAAGNLYFDGTVQVDGEVMQGMKVQASGDIKVGGTVDGAMLEAGGNVWVGGGIIAQATVRAGGAVEARFAENSTLQAGTVIAVQDMALQCTLLAGNKILVGDKSPQRGRLVGGSATATMLVRVPILGSDNAGVTQVMVGTDPVLKQQMHELLQRLELEQSNEGKLQILLNHLSTAGDPKGMLEKVMASWQNALQVCGELLVERAALEEKMAGLVAARVQVGVGVQGPVDLGFRGKTKRVRTAFGKGQFASDSNGEVRFIGPSGHADTF